MKKIATLLVGTLLLTSCDQDFQRNTNADRSTQERTDHDLPANPQSPPNSTQDRDNSDLQSNSSRSNQQ